MTKVRQDLQAALDAPSAVVAAAYISGLNMLVVNLQPLILGAFAESYGFSDRELGHIGAIFVGFATACSLSGPLWVRRVDWRRFSRLMIVLAVLTLLGGAHLNSAAAIFGLFAVLGLLKAALGIPAFASLGDGSNPDRNYGVSVGFQGLLAAAVTAPAAAYVIPRYGVPGLFMTIALIVATGLAVSHWMPREGTGAANGAVDPGSSDRRGSWGPALIALIALGLFTGAILGFWYFIERIGTARGVPADVIGLTLSGISLASIATASLVAWLGGRFSSLAFAAAGTALLVAAFGAMQIDGNAAYIGGTMAFAMGWGLAQPAYYAFVRKVDATGRLFVAAPAAAGIAGVIIGIAAGPVIERGGYQGLIVTCAALALLVLATAASARAFGKARRAARALG